MLSHKIFVNGVDKKIPSELKRAGEQNWVDPIAFNQWGSNLTILGPIAPHTCFFQKALASQKVICMPGVVNFASIDAVVIVTKTVSYKEEINK